MNEIETIEELLRKAPRLSVPSGLREKLRREIMLPQTAQPDARKISSRPWLRSWLPVLSFSAVFLACLVAIAVQSNMLAELRRQNETLRTSTQDLETLRQANAEYQQLLAQNQRLEKLRRGAQELDLLRSEASRLRAQLRDLPSLQAENERLRAAKQVAESRLPAGAAREEDPFAAGLEKAQRIQCINNIKQIGLAARIWANDNGDVLPADFIAQFEQFEIRIAQALARRVLGLEPRNAFIFLGEPGGFLLLSTQRFILVAHGGNGGALKCQHGERAREQTAADDFCE